MDNYLKMLNIKSNSSSCEIGESIYDLLYDNSNIIFILIIDIKFFIMAAINN